jgi:predicted enzyme related to lactoylglutathione lyase
MSYNFATLAGRPLVQVALTVRDIDRARTFYRDVLGLPLMFEVRGMMFFQLKETRLMVGLEHGSNQPIGGSLLYFDAPDIESVGRALEEKGFVFVSEAKVVQRGETHDLKLREFLDPDGNALALMGQVAR